jgi:hypothetical protein
MINLNLTIPQLMLLEHSVINYLEDLKHYNPEKEFLKLMRDEIKVDLSNLKDFISKKLTENYRECANDD